MKKLIQNAAFSFALGCLVASMASAQNMDKKSNQKSSGQMSSRTLSATDRTFIKKAAEGGMAEVQLGQLAEQNGSSDEVKKFGRRMVDDHTKANEELKQLAASKGVDLPSSLNAKDEATKNRLSKLSGHAFDRAYMQDMVKDHIKDVTEFKHVSRTAKDPDVKNFASQTLPTLEEHLKEAKSVVPTQTTASAK